MEKLKELVELAKKADYNPCGLHVSALETACTPETILAIAEAFSALEQRAEAAEASLNAVRLQRDVNRKLRKEAENKLAELEKQKPDYYATGFRLLTASEIEQYDRLKLSKIGLMKLFTRPAPRVSLAPVSNCLSFFTSVIKSGEGWSATCQREIDAARETLRNIEEAKKK